MRLPRKTPREVYRLYAEDEYLAGATWEPDAAPALKTVAVDLRRRRALSAAILLGAMGAVGGLVALSSLSQPRTTARRMMAHRSTMARRRVSPSWTPQTRHLRSSPRGPVTRRAARHPRRAVELALAAATLARHTTVLYVASARAQPVEFGFER